MKKTNKVILGMACLSMMGITNAKAATTLPEADEYGRITLTEDVTLSSKYLISADKDLVIDLNGYTITGPTTNYAIDNRGKLEITNGNIVCPASTLSYDSSCIRNYKELTMDKVDVNASWTAVKNEEASILSIKDTKLFSDKNTAGVVMNYGTATIENSEVIGNKAYRGTAIFALSYAENGKTYDSMINVKNSVLDAYDAVLAKQTEESKGTIATQVVTIEGGTIVSTAKLEVEDNSKLMLHGEVEAPIEALEYALDGTSIIVNSSKIEGEIEIPKQVKVTFTENTDLTDAIIKTYDGATIVNNTSKEIKVIVVDAENKEVTIPANTIGEIKIEENKPNEDDNKPAEDNKKPDNTINENPKTNDGIFAASVITILSLGALAVASKKVLSK